jgi:hypothetical protein
MELLGDLGQVYAHFGLYGDNINLDARCTVCAKCTTGMEIILARLDGIPS